MDSATEIARAALSEAAGRDAITRVVPLLERAGVEVMPLKGAWLQACVYGSGGQSGVRAITDVDLLVRETQFDAALAALRAGGFHPRTRHTASEQALDHPDLLLPIDLHCRLFTRFAFRLSTRAMFERAQPDAQAFDVPLLLPDPRDAFAHLIGHFVKSRTRLDDRMRLADFGAIAARFALDPHALAAHLDAAGMARATRFVLHDLADSPEGAFCRALIAALPADATGALLAAMARRLALHAAGAPRRGVGAIPGFLLDRSLGAGALSLGLRALELAVHRATARPHQPM